MKSLQIAGFSQSCYVDMSCDGDSFPVASARECCVGTSEGHSYSETGDSKNCTVRECVGTRNMSIFFYLHENILHAYTYAVIADNVHRYGPV